MDVVSLIDRLAIPVLCIIGAIIMFAIGEREIGFMFLGGGVTAPVATKPVSVIKGLLSGE